MIELNLTRKRLLQIFLERRFRWGKPHRRPFHSLPTDSAPHSKKTLQKFSLLERFFWPVQRPNPRNNPPFVIENTARKSIPLSVIARKNLIHLSLRGAKRRSNPEKERWYTGLLRYARNDG